jgi:outer membrane protein assembly factor BamD
MSAGTGVRRRVFPVVLFLVYVAVGCSKDIPSDLPPNDLYRFGVEEYERGKYDRAIEALQRFLFQDPGHSKADSAQYLVGESYFGKKQYLTAASEYLRLAQNRPAAPLADDARYKACLCYYELSPRPELDQAFTLDAIEQCRSVMLLYPASAYAAEAASRIRELIDKLAEKDYLTAAYYFKRKAYESAIVYLEHVVANYTGTAIEPEAMLKLYESYLKVGFPDEAEDIKNRLLNRYPDSPQAEEVKALAAQDAA